jgi:RNA 2',3'-cyclic 3'-phosphodiesterase
MAKKDTIRTFIAAPVPQAILEALSRLQNKLAVDVPPNSIRWVKSGGIHLTLKFLGDTPVDKLPGIKRALASVAQHAPTGAYTVQELGCFPRPSRPRVLWVSVHEPTGLLETLQAAIEEAMSHLGYEPEGRKFHPHLTLGRVNRRTDRRGLKRISDALADATVGVLGEAPLDHFELIQSVLKPSGAEYSTLEAFPLRGNEGS